MKKILLYIRKCITLKKGGRRVLLISLCNAILLLFLSYFLNNQPLFTGEDLNQYAWMEYIKKKVGLSESVDYKDAIFINVSYDKQLVEKCDEYEMPIGNVDITDREKILDLLNMLEGSNQYRYVILDVRFEKGFRSDIDSVLFAKILGMNNIVIANHEDIELADSALSVKAAISDYASTIVATNFARYKYLYGKNPSVPLTVYKNLTGNTITKHGLFYTSGGKLCQNSLFLHFPTEGFAEYDENGNKAYYNLGSDILDNYSASELATLCKNKFVFIGDVVEDVHDTYSGLKPGIIITYHALSSLFKGEHIVPSGLMLFLAIIFFFISLSLFREKSIIESIPFVRHSRSRTLHFLLSFMGYATILFVMVIVLNLFFGVTISILVPSLFFAIQKTIINFKRLKI